MVAGTDVGVGAAIGALIICLETTRWATVGSDTTRFRVLSGRASFGGADGFDCLKIRVNTFVFFRSRDTWDVD